MMKRFLLFLVTTSFLLGEIVQIQSIKNLEDEVLNLNKKTWVVFDVDFTLIIPKEPILWGVAEPVLEAFALEVNPQFKERNRPHDWSLFLRDMEWELISLDSPKLVRSFQEAGATVIALTAMPHGPVGILPSLADWRENQLNQFGFDFSLTSPDTKYPKYSQGILYSDNAPKGSTLVAFLDHLGEHPDRIIFVDDREDFVASVEEALNERGIPHTCYHYREVESRSVIFNPKLVREKLQHFFEHASWPTHFNSY